MSVVAPEFAGEGLRWVRVSQPRLSPYAKSVIVASFFAIAAIALIAVGKYLRVRSDNPLKTPGWILMGVGGAVGLIEAIVLFIRYNRKPTNFSYTITSYNMGTFNDFRNVTAARDFVSTGGAPAAAMPHVDANPPPTIPSRLRGEYNLARARLLRGTFEESQKAGADFICLQENGEFDVRSSLPANYYSCTSGATSLIAWDNTKFQLLAYADFTYDSARMGITNSSDTILLFQDRQQGVRLCITSAYLRAYNLAEPRVDHAARGDYQTDFNLYAMSRVEADVYIFAGDFNVPRPCTSSTRLTQLLEARYVTDVEDNAPTIFDANLRDGAGLALPVKLDHIYARGAGVGIQSHPVSTQTLDNFDRASDHLPVGAVVSLRKS